tara:strand:- start:67 stop:315 length:249 start_codon:yes stop_codon:yes gene_type:complete
MKIKTLINLLENVKGEVGEDAFIQFYWMENYNLDGDCHFDTIIPCIGEPEFDPVNWVEITFGKYEDVSAESGSCGCCNRTDE